MGKFYNLYIKESKAIKVNEGTDFKTHHDHPGFYDKHGVNPESHHVASDGTHNTHISRSQEGDKSKGNHIDHQATVIKNGSHNEKSKGHQFTVSKSTTQHRPGNTSVTRVAHFHTNDHHEALKHAAAHTSGESKLTPHNSQIS